ncbi:hypothetical protein Pla144_29590 [Bythopirellula polymerisocia]|uniref:DUF1559 domain-containing protein n=2 Tax=Bythopirellula polymerisocia TaxID=2528003 RepID=A0A5C6CQ54_9BACT|nr:hypothetical protein Pla144_29590 [Bythopirellula polymerisocia]
MFEVLAVIAIIAVLIAILLPAIQSARESARRAQCQGNLYQINTATQSIHAAEGALPSHYNGTALPYPLREWDLFHMHSWRVPLLPYLEQAALKQQLKMDKLATEVENEAVAQSVVPTFICPSGGDPSNMKMGRAGLKHGSLGIPPDKRQEKDFYHIVRSDYDAMAGIQVHSDPLPADVEYNSVDYVHWGIWGWAVFDTQTITGSRLLRYRRGTFRDVTDGLSNTIAFVERGGKPIEMRNGKPEVTADNPNAEYPGQIGWSASNTFIWSINRNRVGVNESNSMGIYSFHPGGANVAIADGAVKFLSDATDFDILVSLFGRSDGGLPK